MLNVDISKEEKLLLMRWRIRMAEFGENFKGGRKSVECPLCLSHPDTQQKSFFCPKLTNEINIRGTYDNIFDASSQEIPILVKTLFKIEQRRKTILDKR